MPDIFHDLWIKSDPKNVYNAICRQPGLDHWWTKSSEGTPELGSEYKLFFGPEHDWRAEVTLCSPPDQFEWTMTSADQDWLGSRVGFLLSVDGPYTRVRFYHCGWPEDNNHFRRSSYCWAMYLRALKYFIEEGEIVPYEIRTSI